MDIPPHRLSPRSSSRPSSRPSFRPSFRPSASLSSRPAPTAFEHVADTGRLVRAPGASPGATLAVILSLALLATLGPRGAFADELTVFTTPPSSGELADILFPPRTRSIVIDGEVSGAAAASVAAAPRENASGAAATGGAVPGQGGFGLLVNFEYGKADITAAARPYLDSVGQMLKLERAGDQAILIEGHTDAVGSDAYNQWLSEQRALAVQRYLVSVHRIDQRRLRPVGKGETRLHAPAEPNAAINRRVEFRLLGEERDGA